MHSKLHCRHPGATALLFALLFWWDSSGFFAAALLAALWHELGHILFWRCSAGQWPMVELSAAGLSMAVQAELLPSATALGLAFAGPAFNLLAALTAGWLLPRAYFLRGVWQSANLITAAFNLLPIPPLDGYVMGKELSSLIKNKKSVKVQRNLADSKKKR